MKKKEVKEKNFAGKKKLSLKARIFLILGSVVLLFFLVTAGIWAFLKLDDPEEFGGGGGYIYYYPANYEQNIYENQIYMSYNRDLIFSTSKDEQIFNYETDYESASAECKFFLDYFHTVIEGDYTKIQEFYTEDYFETEPKFTMQMIYEPYVVFNSSQEETVDGKEIKVFNFYVRYKIYQNNGTFRKGVASNAAIPQIYQLIQGEDEKYLIRNVLDISFE